MALHTYLFLQIMRLEPGGGATAAATGSCDEGCAPAFFFAMLPPLLCTYKKQFFRCAERSNGSLQSREVESPSFRALFNPVRGGKIQLIHYCGSASSVLHTTTKCSPHDYSKHLSEHGRLDTRAYQELIESSTSSTPSNLRSYRHINSYLSQVFKIISDSVFESIKCVRGK